MNQVKRHVLWAMCLGSAVLVLLIGCLGGQMRSATSTPEPTRTMAVSPTTSTSGAAVIVDYDKVLEPGPREYGTNGWWTDEDAGLWRARYAELAPRVVRVPLMQSFVEPVNDDSDPEHVNWAGFHLDEPLPWFGRTITYRRCFEALRDADVTLMIHLPYLAGWLSANGDTGPYSTYPPADLAEYREYIQATLTYLVDTLDYPPQRIILEPVNEPDLACGQDPAVPCFWANWEMADLVAVVRAAHDAAQAVDPAIRVVGLSECCGTELTQALLDDYGGDALLDGLTYHRYVHSFDFSAGLDRGRPLQGYGKPVYINEYGNTKYWSDGEEGALWHSYVLPLLWQEGINPVQFSMAEFPGMHQGYDRLGLFRDWSAEWQPKPAYWVYVNFYNHLGGTDLVAASAPSELLALAGRREVSKEEAGLVLWVVNLTKKVWDGLQFEVTGFPQNHGTLRVFDNLTGKDALETQQIEGEVLTFTYDLPARSSFTFVIASTTTE